LIIRNIEPALSAGAFSTSREDKDIEWHYTDPSKTMENDYVQTFKGGMRDELPNATKFRGLSHSHAVGTP
jgi:hypothetical protein